MSFSLKRFKRERDAALLSLDPAKIRTYMQKWNGGMPTKTDGSPMDDYTLLIGAHKARFNTTTLPEAARQESLAWLTERGFTTETR